MSADQNADLIAYFLPHDIGKGFKRWSISYLLGGKVHTFEQGRAYPVTREIAELLDQEPSDSAEPKIVDADDERSHAFRIYTQAAWEAFERRRKVKELQPVEVRKTSLKPPKKNPTPRVMRVEGEDASVSDPVVAESEPTQMATPAAVESKPAQQAAKPDPESLDGQDINAMASRVRTGRRERASLPVDAQTP